MHLESSEEDDDSDGGGGGEQEGDEAYEYGYEEEEGEWYVTEEDDTIASISRWKGLDEDEMLDINRRRIRGMSSVSARHAKTMRLQAGIRLQLSEKIGDGWGDGEEEEVPVIDHVSRRSQRRTEGAAAARPSGRQKKSGSSKRGGRSPGRRGSQGAGRQVAEAPANPIPPGAHTWVNEHQNFLFRYVPQIEDEVTYIKSLHENYNNMARSRLITPPYEAIRSLRSAEHCRVTSLEYFLAQPPTITKTYAKLKLERLWEEGERASRTQTEFDLIVFPTEEPEFLVLTSWYKQQVATVWAPGQRVSVPFLEQTEEGDTAVADYKGEVVKLEEEAQQSRHFAAAAASTTANMVNTVEVKWDDGSEATNVSPWELIPLRCVSSACPCDVAGCGPRVVALVTVALASGPVERRWITTRWRGSSPCRAIVRAHAYSRSACWRVRTDLNSCGGAWAGGGRPV